MAEMKHTVGDRGNLRVGAEAGRVQVPERVFQTCEGVQSEMAGLGGDAKCYQARMVPRQSHGGSRREGLDCPRLHGTKEEKKNFSTVRSSSHKIEGREGRVPVIENGPC